MTIFLQFTLTDTRSLTADSIELLSKPNWPIPTPNTQFVRCTGKIVQRRKKGLRSWVGEGYLCEVRRGINVMCDIKSINFKLKNLFNNLYCGEQLILNRYEFVFKASFKDTTITQANIYYIIGEILKSSVTIKISGEKRETTFSKLSKKLLVFHRENTSLKSQLLTNESEKSIIQCMPQIYILLDENEQTHNSEFKMDKVDTDSNSFKLFSMWYTAQNMGLKIWLHERGLQTNADIHRKLRISIQRIFCEYECLKNIFARIQAGKIDVQRGMGQSDVLQKYFNRAISTFLREEKGLAYGNEFSSFSDEFSNFFDTFHPGDLNLLKERIKNFEFRPSIETKVTNIITNMSKYDFSHAQIGAAGDNAKADNITFNQKASSFPYELNFEILKAELEMLKDVLQENAITADELTTTQNISLAYQAADAGKGSDLLKYLKASGSWAIDTATKIGVSVVAELLKQHI